MCELGPENSFTIHTPLSMGIFVKAITQEVASKSVLLLKLQTPRLLSSPKHGTTWQRESVLLVCFFHVCFLCGIFLVGSSLTWVSQSQVCLAAASSSYPATFCQEPNVATSSKQTALSSRSKRTGLVLGNE